MDLSKLLSEDLMSFEVEVDDYQELFKMVSDTLFEKGFVTDGYVNGISKREQEFPTGLITEHLNIALPHSDTVFVNQPFIYFVRLKNAIIFKQMGDSQEMNVKNVFFLGIKEPSEQVTLLSSMMDLFMNQEFVAEFINSKNAMEVLKAVQKYQK